MFDILFVAACGIGLAAFAIDAFDKDDDDDVTRLEPDPEQPASDMLVLLSEGDTVDTGAGDDTIRTDGFVDEPFIINSGAGDDTIDINATDSQLTGGSGDDLILLQGYGNEAAGGEGDDTMVALEAEFPTTLRGGTGDDSLSLNLAGGPGYETSVAFGDEGNDTLRADLSLSAGTYASPYAVTPTLEGGAGDDTFEVNLTSLSYQGTSSPAPQAAPVDAGTAIVISDFVPGEDMLVIDSDISDGTDPFADLTLESFALEETLSGSTEVALTLTNQAGDRLVDVAILLQGATGVTEADLDFSALEAIQSTSLT